MKIGESIDVVVNRQEPNFDRACDSARYLANSLFEIDEAGHSDKVEGWQRFNCWIEIDFVAYKQMCGRMIYTFSAKALRSED